MKKYKLIKEYDSLLKINSIVQEVFTETSKKYKYIHGSIYLNANFVENHPEFWEEIKEFKIGDKICYQSHTGSLEHFATIFRIIWHPEPLGFNEYMILLSENPLHGWSIYDNITTVRHCTEEEIKEHFGENIPKIEISDETIREMLLWELKKIDLKCFKKVFLHKSDKEIDILKQDKIKIVRGFIEYIKEFYDTTAEFNFQLHKREVSEDEIFNLIIKLVDKSFIFFPYKKYNDSVNIIRNWLKTL